MSQKPLTYRDLELEVSNYQADGTFQVRVLASPVGGMTVAEAVSSRYDPSVVPEGSQGEKSLEDLLRRFLGWKANRAEMMELGARLADILLPGRVEQLYRESLASRQEGEGLRLRLRIEPKELANLPWELLHVQTSSGERNPNDFLAWQRRVSLTRYEAIGKGDKALDPAQKIRLAMVLASPMGVVPLDLEKEERAILSAVAAVNKSGQVVEVSGLGSQTDETAPATRQELPDIVKGAHIFHFAGHGRFEEGKEGQILLEDADGHPDGFNASQLANLLGDQGVRLAVLGACDGGRRDELNHWTGVAPALVRERVPAVVAMQDSIRDWNAAVFGGVLYARLLAGYSIDEAVFEGRQAIIVNAKSEKERDWAMPVLYLRDEDGVLFPVPEESAGADQPVLRVRQELGTVDASQVIGAEVGRFIRGEVDVYQQVDIVKAGSTLIGAKIDQLGSNRREM